jgi:mannose-6-phosphate isomerase-like protein (cupin superfamily)
MYNSAEHLVIVLEGTMQFIFDDKKVVMKPNDAMFVPANVNHTGIVLDGPVKALEIYRNVEDDYYNR